MAMDQEPVYWSAAMPERVSNRQEIPDVELLQQHYVRYSSSSGAVQTTAGWQREASHHAQAQLADVQDSPGMQDSAPERIVMEIIRAPAEFAVPVKQDRRLKPPFKVRVRLWHKAPVCLPVAVTAHAIVQDEYSNLENWIPPAIDAAVTKEMVERSTPTELKGTTSLTYQFDAPAASGTSTTTGKGLPPRSMAEGQGPMDASDGFFAGPSGRHGAGMQHGSFGTPGVVKEDDWTEALRALVDEPNSAGGMFPEYDYQSHSQRQRQQQFPGQFGGNSGSYDLGGMGGNSLGNSMGNSIGNSMGNSGGVGRTSGGTGSHGMQVAQQQQQSSSATEVLGMISHDFEFDKLEFAKPSRMNKVYIVFACQVSNLDLFFTVFTVPTICFCRREQKDRAYAKLGIPYRTNGAAPQTAPRASASAQRARPPTRDHDGDAGMGKKIKPDVDVPVATRSDDPFANMLDMDPGDSQGDRASHCNDPSLAGGGLRYSEKDVIDLINDRYMATGLSRPLTKMDRDALLARFGFPQMGRSDGSPPTITQDQFSEFARDWESILLLLRKIHHCWVADSPHIVCGFEMDHPTATGALRNQPPGTFLCRLSFSRPGDMVLVCKVPPNSPNADEDCLVHGLLNVNDFHERRVDVWINDFPGATHLLDVYCNKRVDKRKAFPSQYARLEQLEQCYSAQP